MLISVVIPVHDGARLLSQVLDALVASTLPRHEWELIVVDDASRDHSALIAAEHSDAIVRLRGVPRGPAYARNRGVEVARADTILFVDADVCVAEDALDRIVRFFESAPGVCALTGEYDDRYPRGSLVSQYRNLLHRYAQLDADGRVRPFTSGFGAVRRDAFIAVGMYDEWHFSRPQVEGIELGNRLRALGQRIEHCPGLRARHLKHWSLWGMIACDIRHRWIPLVRVGSIGEHRRQFGSLGLPRTSLSAAAFACLAAVSLCVALLNHQVWWMASATAAVVAALLSDFQLYRFLAQRRGVGFAVGAAFPHLLWGVATTASLLWGWLLAHVIGEPEPDPTVDAFAEVGIEAWPPMPVRRPNDDLSVAAGGGTARR